MNIEELEAQVAALREEVVALRAELNIERQINCIMRKKTGRCRRCQDRPEPNEGAPMLTEMERIFCEQGHRFKMLSPDQFRTLRTW